MAARELWKHPNELIRIQFNALTFEPAKESLKQPQTFQSEWPADSLDWDLD